MIPDFLISALFLVVSFDTCGTTLKNVYASGWAATGAKGVLASTMMDAYGVADTIISDWQANGQNKILNLEEPLKR